MKNSANVLVLTILTCCAVHSYDTYNNQNFSEDLLQDQQTNPKHARPPGDTAYKWERRTYGYGLPKILNLPPINEYIDEKEIPRSPSNGYNYFGPEYDIRGYPGNRYEYQSHPHLVTPQGDHWPPRDSKNWPHDDGRAFPYPDPDQFKISRFPFLPPELPPGLTSSPLSDMKTQSCIKNCPSTPEYNPVCGTNGVTYENPGKLECAKYCGVDVALQRKLPCNQATSAQPPTVTPPPTDTQPTTVALPPMVTQQPMDTQSPMDTQPPIVTTKASFEAKPSPTKPVANDPFADRLVFVSTESPDSSEDFDIDIRSRNLKPDDEIVFED